MNYTDIDSKLLLRITEFEFPVPNSDKTIEVHRATINQPEIEGNLDTDGDPMWYITKGHAGFYHDEVWDAVGMQWSIRRSLHDLPSPSGSKYPSGFARAYLTIVNALALAEYLVEND